MALATLAVDRTVLAFFESMAPMPSTAMMAAPARGMASCGVLPGAFRLTVVLTVAVVLVLVDVDDFWAEPVEDTAAFLAADCIVFESCCQGCAKPATARAATAATPTAGRQRRRTRDDFRLAVIGVIDCMGRKLKR